MIDKVVSGYRPAGLLHYLFGPGKFEEHKNPRVVASWDGAPWLHQPDKLPAVELNGERVKPGEFDFDLGPLVATMQQWPRAAGLPLSNPPRITPEWEAHLRAGKQVPRDAPPWVKFYKYDEDKDAVVLRPGYVWHCPLRLHPDDPILSDEQWGKIAERMMKAAGIHQAGCRWIAIRHDDTGIHLMATLVSEHTGKRFYPYLDWPRMRTEAQKIERELGLTLTAGADKTALRTPTRQEKGKAARLGRTETPREELRRVVTQAAAATATGAEFLDELRQEGLNPITRHDADGRVIGYKVALPGDLNAEGTPVFFSGTELAPDLTWPKLEARWAGTTAFAPLERAADGRVSPAARRDALDEAAAAADRATATIRGGSEDTAAVAHATGEVLSALARGLNGRDRGLLADIAERYDRAARTPYRVLPRSTGSAARELRRASRRIAAAGALTGRGNERFAVFALLLALAGLVAEIAAWRQLRGHHHQATAARTAAGALTTASRGATRTTGPGTARPAPSQPSGGTKLDRERPAARRDGIGVGRRPRGTAPG